MSLNLASCNIDSSPGKLWKSTQRQGLSSHFFHRMLLKFSIQKSLAAYALLPCITTRELKLVVTSVAVLLPLASSHWCQWECSSVLKTLSCSLTACFKDEMWRFGSARTQSVFWFLLKLEMLWQQQRIYTFKSSMLNVLLKELSVKFIINRFDSWIYGLDIASFHVNIVV